MKSRNHLTIILILVFIFTITGCDKKIPEGIRREMYEDALKVIQITEENFKINEALSEDDSEVVSNFLIKYESNESNNNNYTYKEKLIYNNLGQAHITSLKIKVYRLVGQTKEAKELEKLYDEWIKVAKEILEIN